MSTDAPDNQANARDQPSPKAALRARSRMLPFWGWILLAGYAAAVVYVRGIDGLDPGIANIITLICTFLTCCAIFVWFCFHSGFGLATRRTVLVGVPSIILLLLALFRVDGVRGDMMPRWSWRWAPRPDQLLAASKPAVDESRLPTLAIASNDAARNNAADKNNLASSLPKSSSVDLSTTTPDDFPQFLGPRRNSWIPGPALDADWSRHEPKLLWRQPIGAGWSAFSVVNGFAVTLEQRGEEELTTCYEALTGKLMWRHAERTRHDTVLGGIGPRSTPTLFQGKVYSLGATGILNCLDGATGAVLWTHHLLDEYHLMSDSDMQNVPGHRDASSPRTADGLPPTADAPTAEALRLDTESIAWGRAASPLVVDGLVVVPAGGPPDKPKVSLVAFEMATGVKAWEAGDDQIAYASPTLGTVSGVRQILSVNEKTVTGHDPETGKVFWSFPWEGLSNQNPSNSQPVAVGDNRVFVSKGYMSGSTLMEVDCDEAGHWTTKKMWGDTRIMKTKFSNVVLRDGFAYGLSDGTLECIDVAAGKRRWKQGRYGFGQILGVGDLLIVQAESGDVHLVAIDPKSHRELAHLAALDGKTWNNPTLYGRYLLVRNGEQAACFELPLIESSSPDPSISRR